ncbi:dienelactone hydrolase family protein [Planomicrobium sp. YIM 101495]|uniref:dienelactone hydrolase family protein n=1 Tax=Planomicrobium sp. YIM 101495 TaxID=2665160 RepID=UPI0012B9B3D6|nr:dienelactone hydrolase family protein [Planomicrobium sp. YIM 101495]MTD31935.1 dienelactone hydrolase family protein [Planomicrobium sp. YIM 101495]
MNFSRRKGAWNALEYKQNAKKCVILLHEIYGINQHITGYAKLFFQEGFDVYVPDLSGRSEPFSYEEEELAYENFMSNVGFSKAAKQVEQLIQEISPQYEEVRIVGFSVGATIAWLCSANPSVQKVIGFYGSRIRQYVDIVPTGDVFLIYSEHEK